MATSLLAGCGARDPIVANAKMTSVGNWRIERQVDRVTGQPVSNAYIDTRASHTNEVFPQPAFIQLECFKAEPIVRVGFNVKVGSTRNAEVGYRFDERPGHTVEARFVDDYKGFVIEDHAEIATFVNELATSQQLYIRIRSLTSGRAAVTFKVDGAPEAIAAAYAGCPIPPPEPPKPEPRKKR